MTFLFETYGCQMNIAESSALERQLLKRGWTQATSPETADMVIINTCSVRITAEDRIFGRIGNYKAIKEVHPLTLIVTGCMAERLHDELKEKFPQVDYVLGNFQKQYFPQIIQATEKGLTLSNLESDSTYVFPDSSWEPGTFSTFVPIMHGCDNFCTYCIVPYVRGREVSRNPEDVLKEISELETKNVKEITLLGQNVNSYRYNEINFPKLLKKISDSVSNIEWIRFISNHPRDVSQELIDVMAKDTKLCHHLHLPVQHGSNKILSAMNRKYTREQYLDLVERIRKSVPDISLTTDILIGFPGETEQDLEDTLDLMKTVRFESAFMYHYNPREGTVAYDLPNRIPDKEKIARLDRVIKLQHSITKELQQQRLGTTTKVLVESISRDNKKELLARTPRDNNVVFEGDSSLIGSFVNVKLDELRGFTYRGEKI